MSSHSSHHFQEVLLVQFSLYVYKSGLKLDSFHFHLESRRLRFCPLRSLPSRFQINKIFPIKFNIVESLPDREVACLGWDHQGSNFESWVRRAVSSIHLTILRLSWPSLDYICEKIPEPHSFNFFVRLTGLIACPSVRLFRSFFHSLIHLFVFSYI